MLQYLVHSITTHSALALAFELHGERLLCTGERNGIPDLIVQAYDPAHDISYRVPQEVTSPELEEESQIHVPKSLREQIDRHVLSSTLGSTVLHQFVQRLAPAISPLSALRMVLEPLDGVNAALIEANNGGLSYLHRIGENTDAQLASSSLKSFIEEYAEERSRLSPRPDASSIILSGFDLDHFENFDSDESRNIRVISIEDFVPLCDFTEDAVRLVGETPHLYTLAIGAACVYMAMLTAK
ncbi:MAG: hypothetical protein Q8922_14640 [Bacteroidota bacterium]|nr:hypothetical protein [Bacteroidota bacterium]MDP4234264.1 hypothetical protein [Bacteroidota bacterium]MDP4243454.1 hypothetical protein [Bacteroidota bacterium]MDP4289156.1 hypothetical protein [Bacteroidota bacterium]